MKTIARALLALSIFTASVAESHAQIIVPVRPPRPRVVVTNRPVAPSPRHVWVEEDWVPEGRGYRWHGGYWAEPPRARAAWVPGHWANRRRGWVWIPGHWR